jgi:hypothetical protein
MIHTPILKLEVNTEYVVQGSEIFWLENVRGFVNQLLPVFAWAFLMVEVVTREHALAEQVRLEQGKASDWSTTNSRIFPLPHCQAQRSIPPSSTIIRDLNIICAVAS